MIGGRVCNCVKRRISRELCPFRDSYPRNKPSKSPLNTAHPRLRGWARYYCHRIHDEKRSILFSRVDPTTMRSTRGAGILSAGCDGFRYSYDTLGNDFACEIIRVTIATDIKLFVSLIVEFESPNSRNIDYRVLLHIVTLKALLTVLTLWICKCFTVTFDIRFIRLYWHMYLLYQLIDKREWLKYSFVRKLNISKMLDLYKN